MRFEGLLKNWNDERGFGFIEPLQGGEDIFVHIKAFRVRIGRPHVGPWTDISTHRSLQGVGLIQGTALQGGLNIIASQ
jgi:hypothetical protein